MSREKQIKEIARVLCDAHEPCSKCVWGKCDVEHIAIRLYEAGYRKQSEVAKEIFEEIEKHMIDLVDITNTAYKEIGTATFAALKKKYTEGET